MIYQRQRERLAPKPQAAYVTAVAGFATFSQCSPDPLRPAQMRRETFGAWSQPGPRVACAEARLPEAVSGPMRLIGGGAKGSQAPRYVGTHLPGADEACRVDANRGRLATCCSDPQSRGCQRQQSPRAVPARLSRWLMAAC
jgi:hypothetical protein